MTTWITRKRLLMLLALPFTGLLFTLLLNLASGPGYTTSVNQSSLATYAIGSGIWFIAALLSGVYMYSKCSSMNSYKFFPGLASVLLGALLPWLLKMPL